MLAILEHRPGRRVRRVVLASGEVLIKPVLGALRSLPYVDPSRAWIVAPRLVKLDDVGGPNRCSPAVDDVSLSFQGLNEVSYALFGLGD